MRDLCNPPHVGGSSFPVRVLEKQQSSAKPESPTMEVQVPEAQPLVLLVDSGLL